MRPRKHPTSTSQQSLEAQHTNRQLKFTELDWIAAFFVIATPLYIAYLLIWA